MAPLPGPPRPGPVQDHPAQSAGVDSGRIREEISTLLMRIDAEPGVSTELFESAHEVLLRALDTVDRA